MRALLSVFDKTSVVSLAKGLIDLGWEVISTGGTLQELASNELPVTAVSELTGFPEILDGRVKTLHPMIHGGLLGRPDLDRDAAQLATHGIRPIELLAVNLYPFATTIAQSGITDEEAVEQIDIGGPALLRAAAKNHRYVLSICDPADYARVLHRLRAGEIDLAFRRSLAAKAFAHTSAYDSTVASYFFDSHDGQRFPDQITLAGQKLMDLRYGENPHQRAAAYLSTSLKSGGGVLGARQLQGKELSFNNLLDADAAWSAVQGWSGPAVAIIKHTNPCALATKESLSAAYEHALAGDPVSAFGGIVSLNRALDAETALRISETFFEVILAPGFDEEALSCLRRKTQLRLLEVGSSGTDRGSLDLKAVSGGWLLQEADTQAEDEPGWSVVTDRQPTDDELADLRFAWRAVRHVKSNAIVLAKDNALVGMGAGQPNRLESVGIAARKAGNRSKDSVLASDAFFPFTDGVEQAAAAGITAIIQPGGSIRDAEVTAAANAAGIAMVTTGRRHFTH